METIIEFAKIYVLSTESDAYQFRSNVLEGNIYDSWEIGSHFWNVFSKYFKFVFSNS